MLKHRAPLIVGSLLILALVGFITLYRSSPGELARPHAAVAGSPLITDCNKCHAPQGLNAGCLHCHTEINSQIQEHRGYHDYLAKNKKTECAKCHSDHNGLDFALINKVSWENQDFKQFKHPEAVFQLSGAHDKLTCEQCHNSKHRPVIVLPKFKKFLRQEGYLGLTQACMSCHADPHANGRAWNCTTCHDQKHWKPAPLFNHDKFFPLRGRHDHLSCSQCHLTPRQVSSSHLMQKGIFGPVKGTRCIDCHSNPHRTRWQESCETCHKLNDKFWAVADSRMTKVQHAETVFHLIVPHDKTRCEQCHQPDLPFNLKYPNPRSAGYKRFEKNCEGCHKDEHKGQFVSKYPQCISCHTLRGWRPTLFGVKMHNQTSYPLVGGHVTATCNTCHVKNPQTHVRMFVPTPKACTVCHKDIHYGQFRNTDGLTRCENCHQSTVKWSILVFNHNTQSKFKLDEAHKNVACKDCHPLVTLPNGVRLVQYKPIKSQCSDCHAFANQ